MALWEKSRHLECTFDHTCALTRLEVAWGFAIKEPPPTFTSLCRPWTASHLLSTSHGRHTEKKKRGRHARPGGWSLVARASNMRPGTPALPGQTCRGAEYRFEKGVGVWLLDRSGYPWKAAHLNDVVFKSCTFGPEFPGRASDVGGLTSGYRIWSL